jgi:hypothetical protein
MWQSFCPNIKEIIMTDYPQPGGTPWQNPTPPPTPAPDAPVPPPPAAEPTGTFSPWGAQPQQPPQPQAPFGTPPQPSALSQVNIGFGDVKKAKFGTKDFWFATLRVFSWVIFGFAELGAVITLIIGIVGAINAYYGAGTIFFTALVSAIGFALMGLVELAAVQITVNQAADVAAIRDNLEAK